LFLGGDGRRGDVGRFADEHKVTSRWGETQPQLLDTNPALHVAGKGMEY